MDEKQFRSVLGKFPTGVAIVTARDPAGERLGLTVSSFNSVSIYPPLVLFSLARNAYSFSKWANIDRYAINILTEQQEALSTQFARPLVDKWNGVDCLETEEGTPVLPEALAVLHCGAYARYEGGDHDIIVGRVHSLRLNRPDEQPLIFFGGRYRKLHPSHG